MILHYTAMDSCARALDWLCRDEAQVSAHYLLDRDGTVTALVAEEMRAWHAGASGWLGESDINSLSVGIELVNTGFEPFPEPQMAALEALLAGIMARWGIGPAGVLAHSDVAPGRKIDPGARFDWARLARGGLALHPGRAEGAGAGDAADAGAFGRMLDAIGYPEAAPETRLAAFRLRCAPGRTGPLGSMDMAAARAWLGQLGGNQGSGPVSV